LTSRLADANFFTQQGIVLFLCLQLSACSSEVTKVVSNVKPSSSTPAPTVPVQAAAVQTPIKKEAAKPANTDQVSTFPSNYVDEGKKKLTHHDSAKAKDLFSKAIEANPLDAEAYFERAEAEKQSSDNKSALQDLIKTIELRPEFFDARMSLAYLYAGMLEHKKSLQEYTKATELRPSDYSAWEGRAWMHNQLKEYTEGADCANKAIEINPKTTGNAREFLAGAYNALGKYDLALKACNEGIKYKPQSDWLYQMRGEAEDRLNELPSAIKDYKKAIEMNPKAWNWLYPGLVSCYDRLLKEKDLN
jgi:tetratricopeptide (TPR) repeat protein